jgi:hypothetical protein
MISPAGALAGARAARLAPPDTPHHRIPPPRPGDPLHSGASGGRHPGMCRIASLSGISSVQDPSRSRNRPLCGPTRDGVARSATHCMISPAGPLAAAPERQGWRPRTRHTNGYRPRDPGHSGISSVRAQPSPRSRSGRGERERWARPHHRPHQTLPHERNTERSASAARDGLSALRADRPVLPVWPSTAGAPSAGAGPQPRHPA